VVIIGGGDVAQVCRIRRHRRPKRRARCWVGGLSLQIPISPTL